MGVQKIKVKRYLRRKQEERCGGRFKKSIPDEDTNKITISQTGFVNKFKRH